MNYYLVVKNYKDLIRLVALMQAHAWLYCLVFLPHTEEVKINILSLSLPVSP